MTVGRGFYGNEMTNIQNMELKLAVNAKHIQALGLYVDKHVLKLEGPTIFHELNPHKYPSSMVGEYDPDNTEKGVYPLEFSD